MNAANALDRRSFLTLSLAAAGVAALGRAEAGLLSNKPASGLIDVNVNLSRWPLRRVRGDDTSALVIMLRKQGVAQAWAGSFDGLLHKDIRSANARLAVECRRRGRGVLIPFGSINPKSPDWAEDLRRCVEEHRMPGIRLHPNYHGYKLDDPALARLLGRAVECGLIVQLAWGMEDERMMHPLLRVASVDPEPLVELVKATPGLRLVLLNALQALRGERLRKLADAAELYVEIATLEGVGGLSNLLEQVPLNRVLFGSYAPLFYFEAAVLKLKESALSRPQLSAIQGENARRLFHRVGARGYR